MRRAGRLAGASVDCSDAHPAARSARAPNAARAAHRSEARAPVARRLASSRRARAGRSTRRGAGFPRPRSTAAASAAEAEPERQRETGHRGAATRRASQWRGHPSAGAGNVISADAYAEPHLSRPPRRGERGSGQFVSHPPECRRSGVPVAPTGQTSPGAADAGDPRASGQASGARAPEPDRSRARPWPGGRAFRRRRGA
jgi:hypothetical protein